ncbi:hypothetical protein [Acetobacter persici]|uniref:Uncharacterized protein n=1 Tax=Acetobacter persici TaxID=1076596 RepID=A0A6V8ICP7_9PROT|nr:hypothetical protein [Acetobacter persici]OUI88761.1 hypothetical protein HK19_15665 [Acetobacter persici]GFE94862.1 hypothetical protein DmAi_29210 [Acetobacter persici]
MPGNKSPNSISADELVPDTKYEMKIWKGRDSHFRSKQDVTFVTYCDSKGSFPNTAFDMKNLDPADRKNCVVVDSAGSVIVLTNRHDTKIWTTDNNDRVTFDKLPAVTTP